MRKFELIQIEKKSLHLIYSQNSLSNLRGAKSEDVQSNPHLMSHVSDKKFNIFISIQLIPVKFHKKLSVHFLSSLYLSQFNEESVLLHVTLAAFSNPLSLQTLVFKHSLSYISYVYVIYLFNFISVIIRTPSSTPESTLCFFITISCSLTLLREIMVLRSENNMPGLHVNMQNHYVVCLAVIP